MILMTLLSAVSVFAQQPSPAPWAGAAGGSGVENAPWAGAQGADALSVGGASPWAGAAAGGGVGNAPWMQPGLAGAAASTQTARLPLEDDWSWERLRLDMDLVARARSGLVAELSAFRADRRRLLVKDPRTAELMIDHQNEARTRWARVADRLVALDAVLERYRRFEEVQDPERRAGAFLGAFSAFAASMRFGREWAAAAGDPSLEKPLDAAVPACSLKAGAFTGLKAAVGRAARQQALAEAIAYARSGPAGSSGGDFQLEGARGLVKAGDSAAFALAGIKEDTRGVRPARVRRSAVPVPAFEPWTNPGATAGVWTGAELDAQAKAKPAVDALDLPWGGAVTASVSPLPQPWLPVIGATTPALGAQEESSLHQIVRLLVERSTFTRPAALVSSEQLAAAAETLEAGDILLLRRERFVEEPGLTGWWTGAGIYVGTPDERERTSGSTDLDGRINTAAPEAYWKSLKPENGFPRRLVVAGPSGVRLGSLERAAAADSLAILRPRLPKPAREQAALRAFEAVGSPYDRAYDPANPAALYSFELVLWAYAETPVALEPREPSEMGPPSANDLARTFDSEYGTSKVALDLLWFFDGRENDGRAVRRGPEDFRLSWKRPRWRFEDAARTNDEGTTQTAER